MGNRSSARDRRTWAAPGTHPAASTPPLLFQGYPAQLRSRNDQRSLV